ncbi:MAG: phosphoribosylanthranilate isomerase [Chloroflexi bacterium]|nr:phosphoribosylanthranilate isomerase [Chloroflexota bacterium]
MKVQLYSIKTPADAAMCVAAGVDLIGIAPGEHGRLKDEVDFERARAIFAAVPAETGPLRVALSVADDPDEIVAMVQAVGPDILHLCGDIECLPPAAVAALRARVTPVKIMQAIPMRSAEVVDLALAYQRVADYFILDTDVPNVVGIGATGLVHDWAISAEIVRRVNIPVILAGGLHAGNVAAAIQAVRPWCVDSFTHTNVPGAKAKDPERVRAFVAAARAAT